jgi:gluconokinase
VVYIVMGVAGCGKTTIGRLLAGRLSLPFFDADDYHPPENVRRMRDGIALTDSDREPWLGVLAEKIICWERDHGGAVLACSALRESYRRILAGNNINRICFIHCAGDKELIASRLAARSGHFMPLSLLDSQLAALEPPEGAITVSIESPPEVIVDTIISHILKGYNRS